MSTATVVKPMQEKAFTSKSELASRGSRLAASLVDALLPGGIALAAFFIGQPLFFFLAAICLIVYQVYLLADRGQTIGKKMMNIKIVTWGGDANGGFSTNVLKRVILNAIISIVPLYALVDIFFIFREDRRCCHDLLASTKVVQA